MSCFIGLTIDVNVGFHAIREPQNITITKTQFKISNFFVQLTLIYYCCSLNFKKTKFGLFRLFGNSWNEEIQIQFRRTMSTINK